jgi:CelD/BcsL family acetyltransferase involved in cellulose biosynthesis
MLVKGSDKGDLRRPTVAVLPASQVENVCVQLVENWSTDGKLEPAWDSIISENQQLTIFSTREWLQSWWGSFGNGHKLECFTFVCGNQTVGIAPFFRSCQSLAGLHNLNHLRLVGGGPDSDSLDLIVRPGHERACLHSWLRLLAGAKEWDVCSLETLAQDSTIAKLLSAELEHLGWVYKLDRVPNWYISLPATWEEYVANLSPDFRPLVTRYPKRLASRYAIKFSRCHTQEELERYLAVLFELHQRRWERARYPGAFASVERCQFYRLMASAFLKRGWLEFWMLELADVPVAIQFCFRYRNTIYLAQEGFDPDYANEKVGYALRARVIQYCISSGIQRYDFMGGSDPYKQRFGAQEGRYITIKFAKPGSGGAFFLQAEELKRKSRHWLRSHLPDGVVARIRSFKKRLDRKYERS